jgi:hypothetical protein
MNGAAMNFLLLFIAVWLQPTAKLESLNGFSLKYTPVILTVIFLTRCKLLKANPLIMSIFREIGCHDIIFQEKFALFRL